MDCREWESVLEDLLEGRLSGRELQAALAHQAACPTCRALFALASGGTAAPPDAGLTRSILDRTSGSPCARARDMLLARGEGPLPGGDAELLDGHLRACPACASLAAALDWLAPILPAMAELDPGEAFTARVLAATSRARAPLASRLSPLREWLGRLWARPRFALEAAYVGGLVLLALFFTPVSPFKEAPPRALAVVQVGPEALIEPLRPVLREAGGRLGRGLRDPRGDGVLGAVGGFGRHLAARGRAFGAGLGDAAAHGGELARAAVHLDVVGTSAALDAIKLDLRSVGRAFGRAAPEPPAAEAAGGASGPADSTTTTRNDP